MKHLFPRDALTVLKFKDFRLFLAFRFFMTSATLMQSVVVGWQLYNITRDVLSLGMIGLTEVIPQVGIALIAGHFIDIWDRRKIIFNTTFLLLFGSALLAIYSIPSLQMQRYAGVLPIFITIFLTGLVRGILMPANVALLGQLVPRQQLAGAATLSSTTWEIAAVAGPALGGLMYGFFGIVPAYLLIFLFFLLCIFILLFLKSPGKVSTGISTNEGIFVRINQGIRYVFKSPVLLGAFTLDMFAVLFGGAVALLPVFASDVLNVGPEGLGVLRACPAAGAILMSIVLTFHPPVNRSGRMLLYSVSGFGLCMIVFAFSESFILSSICLFVSGCFDNVSVVIRSTILQLFTSNEMKGRVAAVNSIFVGSSNELGAFESGLAARIMGLVPSVVFGGVMTLIVVIAAAWKWPKLRNLSLKEKYAAEDRDPKLT
jgi:MFS family permease